ncbi:MAG TPA: protein kinase [Kofleriaceae bacterium]|nr:protein kinase [Kofleriaceae bacterium]
MAASPSPSSDDQFAIGSVLDGRYRIDGVLGTGGMGRVYRAEHTKIGKSVAIKVLHADLHRNREASQRFQREAIASGRLDHPNIVGVSDFGVLDDGACYLVMEVLEGESLGDRLARDGRLAWLEAIDILRGVLAGLRHAHERGVVHRDIKPDNVYLAHKEGEMTIKILDFGIAKLYAGSADDPASTRAGLTVGTPAYLSPEQAVGGEITPASDLYSASIVMYEMLAGHAPFEDRDPLAMLGAHVSRRPPAFSVTAPGVEIPPQLEEIIQHGLVKAAAERIATATDYLAMLDLVAPPSHPMPRLSTAPVIPTPTELLGTADTGAAMSAWARVPPREALMTTPLPSTALPTVSPRVTPIPGALPHHPGTTPPAGSAVMPPGVARYSSSSIVVPATPHGGSVVMPVATPYSGSFVVPAEPSPAGAAPDPSIPAGPAGGPAPDPATHVTSAIIPSVTATPYSGSIVVPSAATPYAGSAVVPATTATPYSGSIVVPSATTPVAGSPVVPGASGSLPGVRHLATEKIRRASRMVSLADVAEPIPKTWIMRSGVFVALAILAAIVLAFVKHCSGSEPATTQPAPGVASGAGSGSSATGAAKPPAKPATGPGSAGTTPGTPGTPGDGSGSAAGTTAGSAPSPAAGQTGSDGPGSAAPGPPTPPVKPAPKPPGHGPPGHRPRPH